jgi:phosphoribosyl 1,2-cyclic phosphodiesterase
VIVRFWGTRGSLPVASNAETLKGKLVTALVAAAGHQLDSAEKARDFIENHLEPGVRHSFGGNSSCVELETGGDEYILCDLGSGVRPFGNAVLARHGSNQPKVFHVLMSHVHWDHIMGFPFFVPAYIPGNVIRIYGCHTRLEEAFRRQQSAPCFPVEFDTLGATIEFVLLEPGRTYDIARMRVTPKLQRHTNDSYGYRIEVVGKTIVYSTDSEHKLDDPQETTAFAAFFRDADLVIFDAMYSLADAISVKEDWGHSSNVVGVELCQLARAKTLCLFHHEPAFDDSQLARILVETRRFEEITRTDHPLEVIAAYDGLEVHL